MKKSFTTAVLLGLSGSTKINWISYESAFEKPVELGAQRDFVQLQESKNHNDFVQTSTDARFMDEDNGLSEKEMTHLSDGMSFKEMKDVGLVPSLV